MTAAPNLLESYRRMDRLLAAKGFPATPPWWMREVERFYQHATALTWAARVGRGGAKSTHAVKFAVNEVLFADFKVGPGERHYFAFVSVNRDEAAQRLRLIEAYLGALGVAYTRSGEVIDLLHQPRGWRVFSCTVGAVSGFRCTGYAADELAKWRAGEDHSNPASEVAASIDAMMITHPEARRVLFSSPLSTLDFHYETIERGDTEHQIVSMAPSWVANPDAITEAMARAAAKGDDRVFRREYMAIPMAAISAVFTEEEIEASHRPFPRGCVEGAPVVVIDAASKGGDFIVAAIVGWCHPTVPEEAYVRRDLVDDRGYVIRTNGELVTDSHGRPMLDPDYRGEVAPFLLIGPFMSFDRRAQAILRLEDIVTDLAGFAAAHGVSTVYGDQHLSYALESMFPRVGLRFQAFPWTGASKPIAVEQVARWMRERAIIFNDPPPALRRELAAFSSKVLPSGTITYGGRGAHDDHVAVALSAALADSEGLLAGSPIGRPGGKRVVSLEGRMLGVE